MKKYLAIVLALCMVLALCACGAKPAVEEAAEKVEEKVEEVAEAAAEKIEEAEAAVEEEIAAEESAEEPAEETAAMSYADYLAAELYTEVTVECYVQAHESWWDNKITVYAQDQDGAYLLYDLACSEEDAAKLEPGVKICVTGEKSMWPEEDGQVEICDGTFEFVEGDSYIAEAKDVTEFFGTDELVDYMTQYVTVKGLEILEDVDAEWDGSADLEIKVNVNGEPFSFFLRRYLTGTDSETYAQVKDLKAGDVIDVDCYLYWYYGPQARIVNAEKVG